MFVGDFGKFVEAATGKFAEAIEMRLHRGAQTRFHVEIEQRAHVAIDAVEIHPATIGRNHRSSSIYRGHRMFRSNLFGMRWLQTQGVVEAAEIH